MSGFYLVSQEMTIRDTPRIEYVAVNGDISTVSLTQSWGKGYGEDRVIADYQLYLSPSAVRALHKALTCAIENEGTNSHWNMNSDLELERLV